MTVVTDTSVNLNLCVIGQQDVLPQLYDSILAPQVVVREFERLASVNARFRGLTIPDFIDIAAPAQLLPALAASARLQAGEIAALSLAVEKRADVILMDVAGWPFRSQLSWPSSDWSAGNSSRCQGVLTHSCRRAAARPIGDRSRLLDPPFSSDNNSGCCG